MSSTYVEASQLSNVFLGATPSFADWDTDPSVGVDRLTDGSIATAMTSGEHVLTAAWQYAYIDFNVANGIYLVGGFGNVVCAAASATVYVVTSTNLAPAVHESTVFFDAAYVMVSDGVIRYGLTANAASTITPNFFELWAARVA